MHFHPLFLLAQLHQGARPSAANLLRNRTSPSPPPVTSLLRVPVCPQAPLGTPLLSVGRAHPKGGLTIFLGSVPQGERQKMLNSARPDFFLKNVY